MVCLRLAYTIYFRVMPAKEEQQERRWTKLKFLCLVSSTLLRVSGTYRVPLALEQLRDVVCKLLHFSASFFWELLLYLMYRWPFEPAPTLTKKYFLIHNNDYTYDNTYTEVWRFAVIQSINWTCARWTFTMGSMTLVKTLPPVLGGYCDISYDFSAFWLTWNDVYAYDVKVPYWWFSIVFCQISFTCSSYRGVLYETVLVISQHYTVAVVG